MDADPESEPAADRAARSDLTGRRLGAAVLAYLALVVGVVTLAPFRFTLTPSTGYSNAWSTFDVLMNVVMFVPLGFVHQLARAPSSRLRLGAALTLGLSLSALVETAQLFLPGRFPSLLDVATNTVGAGLGAAIAAAASGRVDAGQAVRASGVELPLMGLVYVLTPLPWLVSLGEAEGGRPLTLIALTVSAGWIIGSVFTVFERVERPRVLLGMAAWLVVALVPGSSGIGTAGAIAGVAGLAAAWLRTLVPAHVGLEAGEGGRVPRRFEVPTLRVVLPLLVTFVVVSSITPAVRFVGPWAGTLALFPDGIRVSGTAIFGSLERIAAFTVLGYAIAEYHGRTLDRFRTVAPAVLGGAGALSLSLEFARGWLPGTAASGSMFALTLVAAGLGGWLYLLQLAHVRAVSERVAERAFPTAPG